MKKDLSSAEFWDAFGRGVVFGDNKPTPREAADTILALMVELAAEKRKTAQAEHEAKCANQQFKVFAMEVFNLARKYER
jgi:hypothetical protein